MAAVEVMAPAAPASADGGPLPDGCAALHQQLLAHRQRCRWLGALRSDMTTRLLRLESAVAQRRARYGDAAQWIDQPDLERRLQSPQGFLRRALLGRSSSVAERREALKELLGVVEEAVRKVRIFSDWLECCRRDLLKHLAAVDFTPLEVGLPMAAGDVAAAVRMELSDAVERQQQAWLCRQLEQERLSAWRIEGLGVQRLALLEAHGLLHAEHLRLRIDQLTELPGIGMGIQRKLREHLMLVIARLRRQLDEHPLTLTFEDLVEPCVIAQFAEIEHELLDLQRKVVEAEEDLEILDSSLARCTIKRDQLLRAFLAMS